MTDYTASVYAIALLRCNRVAVEQDCSVADCKTTPVGDDGIYYFGLFNKSN
jgi:hypothetical protein